MSSDNGSVAYGYTRLSREEAKEGESNSIVNQKNIITAYCERNSILLAGIFVDDGWSGGNFDRPGFQDMMKALNTGTVNTIVTKDLSRLGRDMRESSYYAEEFFPEHGIRYIAIADNFDTEHDNIMAPFQFAMNEVYLRDGSRKVRDVLRSKRESGEYCACPPYGYKKAPLCRARLIPDEETAPIVKRIFEAACSGDSCRTIAMGLNEDGIIPPLKYRVLYRDTFGEKGAARASDLWNYTTVKRILKNPVYLGHTLLGKSRKISVKSKKKVPIEQEKWAVTENTHEPLVTKETFDRAMRNLGRGTRRYQGYNHIRKSIFSGIAVCGLCGHSLCSCGTVYNGEREKYWYLACTHQRQDIPNPCPGVRIKYSDLVQLVTDDLNDLIGMADVEVEQLTTRLLKKRSDAANISARENQKTQAEDRLRKIEKIIEKLYFDYAEGRLTDARLAAMVEHFETEAANLRNSIEASAVPANNPADDFRHFFFKIKEYTHIDHLDRETLLCFVDRIEVYLKELPVGAVKATHNTIAYLQTVRIHYRFSSESQDPLLSVEKLRKDDLPAPEKSTAQLEKEHMDRLKKKAQHGQLMLDE